MSDIIIAGVPHCKRIYCLDGVCPDCGGALEERSANSYYCKHCCKVVDSGRIRLFERERVKYAKHVTQANDGDNL